MANRRIGVWAVLAIASYVLVPLLFAGNLYLMSMIVAALTIGGIALAWALLGNLGGLVSFGHAAFFGVGAYASALLVMKTGWPIGISLLAGGVCAALSAVLVLPALRLRGPYFALAVLAYAHIFRIVATEWKGLTNGAGGIGNIPRFPVVLGYDFSSKTGAYWIILSLVLAFAVIYRRDTRQPPGPRVARDARQRRRHPRRRRQQHAAQGADALPVRVHDRRDGRVQRALHQLPRARTMRSRDSGRCCRSSPRSSAATGRSPDR